MIDNSMNITEQVYGKILEIQKRQIIDICTKNNLTPVEIANLP